MALDQVADALGFISLVGENDGARIEAIEQVYAAGPSWA